MSFVLIDGVIANDTFATGATAGTSSLVDGINNQAFAAGRSATAQPVDAVLGLTTWAGVSGAAGSLAWTSQNSTIAIAEASSDSLTIGWTTQNSTIAIATNLKNSDALAWTSGNSVIALAGTLINIGSIGWTSADSSILINANVVSAVNNIALSWIDQNSTVALAGSLTDALSLSWTDQSALALTGNVASTSADGALAWTDSSTIVITVLTESAKIPSTNRGGGIYYQNQHKRKRWKGQLDELLDDAIVEYQQQLKGFANRDIAAVKEIVKPFIQQETVDYESLQADIDAIRALMIEYQKYLIRKDEEELLILLLG